MKLNICFNPNMTGILLNAKVSIKIIYILVFKSEFIILSQFREKW